MRKIIIAGSRGFNDYTLLTQTLDKMLADLDPNDIEIVSGTARGADRLGEQYAAQHKLSLKRFPADWDRYGKRAGYLRNAQMADYATDCVLFWDGESRGTKHMYDLAASKSLKTIVVRYTTV